MRTCSNCKKDFKPSSRHKTCPKCRYQLAKNLCECGRQKGRKHQTCSVCASENQKGAKNHNWKGGVIRHSAGYLQEKRPDHPRGHRNGGYVLQHILVMEEKIGRYLLPGENVHHKNGVKDDNRPENLELWVTRQPAGQRPEDLVAWAHEIIDLYGDL